MRRSQQGFSLGILSSTASLLFAGCAPELTISGPADPSSVVVAQFDPTHPVPLLQIVPTPTALAQNLDGPGLNVTTYSCEGASTKQCLKYVSGWPTSTPISLYFSGNIDLSTVKDGIRLFGQEPGFQGPIEFTVTSSAPRALPSASCMGGGNGTVPDRPISVDEIPAGIEIVITPSRPLKPSSSYIVWVESHVEGGLRAADGSRIEASSLFSLLNVGADQAPLDADGNILNALLRENVVSSVAAALFPDKALSSLSTEEAGELSAAVASKGLDLFALYGFFNQIIEPLLPLKFTSRDKLVLINAWQTGPEPVEIAFNPLGGVLPFPNTELLTRSNAMGDPNSIHDVQVSLPIDPSSTSSRTFAFLNTRTGFSNTARLSVPTTGNIDNASLAGNVLMYPISEMGVIDSQNPVPVIALAVDASSASPASIIIQPLLPLDQNASYVVGLKKGIKASDGSDVVANSTFNLMKTPVPIIDDMMNVLESLRPVLQCSTVQTKGELATDQEVLGAAVALEDQLRRPRWQHVFNAFEMLSPAVPRSDLLMAYSVHTQDVTGELDALFTPGAMGSAFQGWQARRAAAGLPLVTALPQFSVTGTTAIYRFLKIAETLCVPLCQGDFTVETDCDNMAGAAEHPLYSDPTCQAVMHDFAGNMHEIQSYLLTGLGITRGNPLNPNQGFFDLGRATAQSNANFAPIPLIVVTGTVTTSSTPASSATIFQHGLGKDKADGLGIANSLLGAGQVVVMMDLPWHGDRASDLINNSTGIPCVDATGLPNIDPELVSCTTSTAGVGVCVNGCDGERDPSATGFMGPNLVGTRDNLRQSVIDQLNLIDALQNDAAFDFIDGDDLSYLGTSLGAVTGGNLMAYTDAFTSVVLNAPGGGITNIITGAPQFFGGLFGALALAGVCDLVDPLDAGKGCKDTAAFRQFLYVAQWILDLGDPLATSVGVGATHNGVEAMNPDKILIQMISPDLLMTNPTSQALGAAYGFDPADNSETSHFQTFNFDPSYGTDPVHLARVGGTGCHISLFAPICGGKELVASLGIGGLPGTENLVAGLSLLGNICGTAAIQTQAVTFIASDGASIALRTANFPPGLRTLIDAALARFGSTMPVDCPTF